MQHIHRQWRDRQSFVFVVITNWHNYLHSDIDSYRLRVNGVICYTHHFPCTEASHRTKSFDVIASHHSDISICISGVFVNSNFYWNFHCIFLRLTKVKRMPFLNRLHAIITNALLFFQHIRSHLFYGWAKNMPTIIHFGFALIISQKKHWLLDDHYGHDWYSQCLRCGMLNCWKTTAKRVCLPAFVYICVVPCL